MAVPTVSSSDPTGGAADVFVNISLTVTFVYALDASTVDDTTVLIYNDATSEDMFANVSYDSSTNKVIITPNGMLPEDTVCTIRFPGTDIAISSDFVIKEEATGDPLLTTVDITFTTGSRVWIDDSSIDKDAIDLSLEGDLVLPTHVKALGDFALSGTVPKNHKSDVSVSLDGSNQIQLTFTKELSSGLCSSDWVDVDIYPILDDTQYLAQSGTFGTGDLPSVSSVTCTGNTLYVALDGSVPNNAGVELSIEPEVEASDGSTYGPSSYVLSFTVARYPSISGVHAVKREIKAAADELNDEYIAALLFSNSLIARNMIAGFDDDTVDFLHMKWVLYKTLIDILDDQELEKALVAGTRRQLGDINISIDAVTGRLAIKHARLLKALAKAEKAIFGDKTIAMRYSDTNITSYTPDRMWYGVAGQVLNQKWQSYQGNYPGSNTAINRKTKISPSAYWWA
jgi:hypothetical protein